MTPERKIKNQSVANLNVGTNNSINQLSIESSIHKQQRPEPINMSSATNSYINSPQKVASPVFKAHSIDINRRHFSLTNGRNSTK